MDKKKINPDLTQMLGSKKLSESPYVVLGMHRSGTTMIAQVLEKAGIFMGADLSGNHEPRIIQDANRQILDYFTASWLDVDRVPAPELLKKMNGITNETAVRFMNYFDRFFDNGGNKINEWGFKDPRTCVTASIFHRLFPKSKCIFIFRDPFDVALSVVAREQKVARKYLGQEYSFSSEESMQQLKRALNSWKEYNDRAFSYISSYGMHVVLRYESVVVDPEKHLMAGLRRIGIQNCKADSAGNEIHSKSVGKKHESAEMIAKESIYNSCMELYKKMEASAL